MNIFNRSGWPLWLFLLLFLFAIGRCHAQSEINLGIGTTVVHSSVPVLDVSWRWHRPLTEAYWDTGLTLWGESNYKGREQSNNAAIRVMYYDRIKRLRVGLGAGLLQNTDAYNGSNANFALGLGWDWKYVSLDVLHFSNANTQLPNIGFNGFFVSGRF